MTLRIAVVGGVLLLAGCAASTGAITAGGSQVELRQLQTRAYDTLDRRATLRSVIATLQDLGFVIDRADYELATVSATRLQDYKIRMTVTVREREEARMSVRANASYNEQPIEDAQSYRDFFAVLDKAMFLTLHGVD